MAINLGQGQQWKAGTHLAAVTGDSRRAGRREDEQVLAQALQYFY